MTRRINSWMSSTGWEDSHPLNNNSNALSATSTLGQKKKKRRGILKKNTQIIEAASISNG